MSPILLWILGIVVVIAVVAGVVYSFTNQRSLVEERLDSYLQEGGGDLEFGDGSYEDEEVEKESGLTLWLNNRVVGSSFGDKIANKLAQADIKLKPGEFVAIMFLSGVLGSVLGYVFGQGGGFSIIFAIIAFFISLFVPNLVVGRMQGRRLKRFSNQLPDMLTLMVNGVSAGFSTMQALEAVSKEMPAPISEEFRRVVQEMQLGIPMEKSLDNLLRRIPSEDLDLVVTAINVQREVGGNLAEILDTITHTIRERIRIKGEITTLTAQVVYSGRLLSFMPVVIAFILWGLNRDYMMEYVRFPACGIPAVVCSILMIFAGYVVMNKIGDIEV